VNNNSSKKFAGSETQTKFMAHGLRQVLLLVEDNEMVRRLLARILRLSDYEVLAAANAEQALHLSDNHIGEIPLMLADLEMPGMNGLDLADAMAKLRPEMSVLFISGYAGDRRTRKVLGDGRDFLSKPFLPQVLINRIREILDRRSPAAGNGTDTVGITTSPARAHAEELSPAGSPNKVPADAWRKAAAATETRAFSLFLELIVGGLQ
jgi:DNA-binding response OmpR family regulator